MLLRAACFAALACSVAARAQDASAPGANGAQTAPAQYKPPTITVTTRMVVLDVVVTDKKGKLVHIPLTRDDFSILEDGQPQQIRGFEPPSEAAPEHFSVGYNARHADRGPPCGRSGDTPVFLRGEELYRRGTPPERL